MSMAHTQTDAFSVNRAGAGRREMVGFRVGDQAFCIDITSVLEIRGWTATTPLPGAPAYMRGVVNLRGTVLPIIDLAYQGLGQGMEQDAYGLRAVLAAVPEAGWNDGLEDDAVRLWRMLGVADAQRPSTAVVPTREGRLVNEGPARGDNRGSACLSCPRVRPPRIPAHPLIGLFVR